MTEDQLHEIDLMHHIHEKGMTVKPIERRVQKPSRKTGLLATLGALLGLRGSSAPAYRRGFVAVCGTLVLLAAGLTATPALAAAPETPELSVEAPVHATQAVVHGILNPGKEGEPGTFEVGTYQFLYKASKTKECEGGSVAPASPGMSLGAGKEAVPAELLAPLAADTEYAVCLEVETAGGKTVSAPVTFETALPPNTPGTAKATGVTASTATLNGVLNPAGARAKEPGSDEFIYQQSATECQGGKTVGASTAPGLLEKEPAQAAVTELLPNAAYTFCLLVRNAAGEEVLGLPETFTTLPVLPTLSAEAATSLTSTSADLTAQIDPNGAATACRFEYGTTIGYEHTVACTSQPGSGRVPVPISQHIEGLAEDTTYHWRVVASNAAGTSMSVDHVFVYSTASAELPDDRAYEMVTPPFKNGALVGEHFLGYSTQFAEDGSRVIALGIQCFAGSESCTGLRGTNGAPFEFTRTPGGWVTAALAPSAQTFSENSSWGIDANTGTALFSMPTGPTEEDEWYARSSGGSFLPLGPVTPPGRTGTNFSTGGMRATADLSHIAWEGTTPFWPFDGTEERQSLYEYVGTGNKAPLLVGVTGERGSDSLISDCGTKLGSGETAASALSADGRIVYFTVQSGAGCVGTGGNSGIEVAGEELFARVDGETSEAHTVRVSPGSGIFQGASEDGSKAFFTEGQSLYESECFTQCETLGEQRRVTDVSAGSPNPEVQGLDAYTADGSHVYFVASGVLTTQERPGCKAEFEADKVAEEGRCQAKSGTDNLYVYERDAAHPEGHIAFVAPLSSEDSEEWRKGGYESNVTPDGRFLVFESRGDLTPDDTRKDGAKQVFRYDDETGQLVRISIGNDGFNDNGNAEDSGNVAEHSEKGRTGVASIAWEHTSAEGVGPARHDPTMSNDGSYVFFMSPMALTPHALNDVVSGTQVLGLGTPEEYEVTYLAQNVYEYHEGHVYLISDGRDTSASSLPTCREKAHTDSSVCLLGTDVTGHNVFFTTADQLVPADTDTQVDIYDARVCEPDEGNPCIAAEPAPLPPCLGEACHGIPAATPSLLAPGTASFNGEGNKAPEPPPKKVAKRKVVKCKHGSAKNKQGKCIKREKPKKARKSARKASNDRRGR